MPRQFYYLLLFLLLFLLLIIITEILHRACKLPVESSRKFIHVSGGLICLALPAFFSSHWWLLPLAVTCFALLFITYKRNWLASIHQTKRKSVGSVLFPIPVYGCFLLAQTCHDDLYFYLPIALLTVSDTAAEIAGNKWGSKGRVFFNGQKTFAGSLAFFLTALPVSLLCLYIMHRWPIGSILLPATRIGVAASITEAITLHGWDNLTVPAVTAFLLLFCL
jgi:phytol kinase